MDALTQDFLRRAATPAAAAAQALGGLIAAPADADAARALDAGLDEIGAGARRVGLVELARLSAEARAPLALALSAGRALDRASLQAVGWAVQALEGALSAARAGCAPLAEAA